MRIKPTCAFVSVLITLCLAAAACGSAADVATTASETETESENSEPASLFAPISEQDLDQARLVFDAARTRWLSLDPFSYTFAAGVDTINLIEVDFDAEGNASPERVMLGEVQPEGWAQVPRSVDEAFDEVETLIARFESGEFAVPGSGDCGNHFTTEFDPDYGAPTYYNELGPCDDGVGIRLQIIIAGEEVDGGIAAEQPCLADEYAGTWLSAEVDAEDNTQGNTANGGVGNIVLSLTDGESALQEGDVVEFIGEWFCAESTLIAISNEGEERELAAINEDGTLTVESTTLTRQDG